MECEHEWTKSDGKLRPFLHVAVTQEEPAYYAPQGFIEVEVCKKCHLIRIPFGEVPNR